MEKVSRGSLETGLPSFASIVALGCFHLDPASEGSGGCCGSAYGGEREPHWLGRHRLMLTTPTLGPSLGLSHPSYENVT